MKIEIPNCIFCGGKTTRISVKNEKRHVYCPKCHSRGPYSDSEQEAVLNYERKA